MTHTSVALPSLILNLGKKGKWALPRNLQSQKVDDDDDDDDKDINIAADNSSILHTRQNSYVSYPI